jgi:2-polyprenyl-3-methyl-5-hydroxy-6-metoxy-1,4-benzoquinol methylase
MPPIPAGFPTATTFLRALFDKAPLQRKRVGDFLRDQDATYWMRAEEIACGLSAYLDKHQLSLENAVDAYLAMCRDMVREQMKFKRTGRYSAVSSSQVYADLYGSNDAMRNHTISLAMSHLFWPNHYAIYDFFIEQTLRLQDVRNYLEIGPGHGLYLAAARRLLTDADFLAVDISPTSIEMSRTVMSHLSPDAQCRFEVRNVFDIPDTSCDYIVMCEVLEHVEDPATLLRKLRSLLTPRGTCFLTTCANCPSVDHIYLYRNVEQISEEITEAGFSIDAQLALPVEDVPVDRWSTEKTGVNYAALLRVAPQHATAFSRPCAATPTDRSHG